MKSVCTVSILCYCCTFRKLPVRLLLSCWSNKKKVEIKKPSPDELNSDTNCAQSKFFKHNETIQK